MMRSRAIRDARTASILSHADSCRGGPDCACVHFEYGIPVEAWWVALIWLDRGHQWFPHGQHLAFWSGKELSLSRRHPFQVLFLVSIVLFIIFKFSRW